MFKIEFLNLLLATNCAYTTDVYIAMSVWKLSFSGMPTWLLQPRILCECCYVAPQEFIT